ncbi:hypothetical protein K437DRAFT_257687 [Tilletiaria anomala UBC 951]|uniref:Uncharacterized protein n=1 Tax=Tilletiaria anomala (strain ATCC 24038 / CBS 436.72 / UBC 951) TaxID=1037660 RepID=A0A066VN34_TILAU|nr:uncharacterized protein K437DRAFT_257687 [Tilletiaria anomala UBC 951]KDN42841.1 hypothetical protein K437DRAFT_257687 [Tilletiaria anomala UBC 951]
MGATVNIEKLHRGNDDAWAFKAQMLWIMTSMCDSLTGTVSKPLNSYGAADNKHRQDEALATLALVIDDKITGSIRMVKAAKEL